MEVVKDRYYTLPGFMLQAVEIGGRMFLKNINRSHTWTERGRLVGIEFGFIVQDDRLWGVGWEFETVGRKKRAKRTQEKQVTLWSLRDLKHCKEIKITTLSWGNRRHG